MPRSGRAWRLLATSLAILLALGALAAFAASADAEGAGPPRAPSGPPLVSGPSAYVSAGEASTGPQAESEAPPTNSEPLVQNGLGSPLCRDAASALPAAAQSNCETSQFVAASDPASHYELDVNIDTGLSFIGDIESTFQDWLIKWPWSVLVWAVHTVLVSIEWSYALDLLSGPAMGRVANALTGAERTFTQPWLAAALAVAAILLAYRGIVKRRVAQSLGEALVALAMMACGLWMIVNPFGTIGTLAGWADAASIQTLGAVSGGTPAHADATLARSVSQLFSTAVAEPWCYLEFGNVSWCEDPRRLDPSLRAVALKLAAHMESEARASGADPERSGPGAAELRSAQLLRAARTNGGLFLALSANTTMRNSATKQGTLLAAICKGPNDTHCHGLTAGEAEFRTERSTTARAVGFVLIAIGLLGMIMLLGFVVTRLLGAALLALVLLLAAPAVVLAPALGDNGRELFRRWSTRLLGAAAAKLIWSCLLGVLLVASRVLIALGGLGWWVQWLLLAILWWGAFLNRRHLLAPASHAGPGRAVARSLGQLLPGRAARHWLRQRWRRRESDGPDWGGEGETTLPMPRPPKDPPRQPDSSPDDWRPQGPHDEQPSTAQAEAGGDVGGSRHAEITTDESMAQAQGDRSPGEDRADRHANAEREHQERSRVYFAEVVQRLRSEEPTGSDAPASDSSEAMGGRPSAGRSSARRPGGVEGREHPVEADRREAGGPIATSEELKGDPAAGRALAADHRAAARPRASSASALPPPDDASGRSPAVVRQATGGHEGSDRRSAGEQPDRSLAASSASDVGAGPGWQARAELERRLAERREQGESREERRRRQLGWSER